MKKLLLLLTFTAIFTLATTANATPCDNLKNVSYAVMKAAQSGLDKQLVIHEANKNGIEIEDMINDAFNYPVIRDKAGKEVIKDLFSRLYYVACMSSGTEV